ncbi:ABC transporter permease [Thermomonospora umbrina]|uniref:ABC transporter permease n=1 Tax=Thermomonospora umbrina TaxID=111806 RepID=A0A3D9SPE9_9ACTN|nr:ABC transporter permease [Thermomonospora umbrina]REE94815.1 hypothetical protein DFJ69_0183 [Thermomonospora umbrina]
MATAHPPSRPPDGVRARVGRSVYLAPVVITMVVAAAAALFAGSYCLAMAKPTPHRMPIGVIGASARGAELVTALERGMGTTLDVRRLADLEAARRAVERQEVFAVLRPEGGGARLDVIGAAGASVARLLEEAGPRAGRAVGIPVTVVDVKPLQRTDPQGLAIFYISLAAVITGFVGAIQLSVHGRALRPAERIAFTLGYGMLGGFAIAAAVDWGLDVLDLPFPISWTVLSLTMATSGMVFTMFNTLVGRWAMLPTWGLMVILGNPSSGGAVSWPLLPQPYGAIGRWLPPGASVNAQHNAIYFGHDQSLQPFLALTGWLLVSIAVFWAWRDRHPGGRPATASA